MVISSKEESVIFSRNASVTGRCSLNSQMSVCRVLGKLSNHVIEVVTFSLVWKRTHTWYCVPSRYYNAMTGHVRKIKALTRSRTSHRSVYYVTCVRLLSYVVDTALPYEKFVTVIRKRHECLHIEFTLRIRI